MPQLRIMRLDTIYIRATALEVCSDAIQVRFDDGFNILTQWVPARECARLEDIAELKPLRRANRWHTDR